MGPKRTEERAKTLRQSRCSLGTLANRKLTSCADSKHDPLCQQYLVVLGRLGREEDRNDWRESRDVSLVLHSTSGSQELTVEDAAASKRNNEDPDVHGATEHYARDEDQAVLERANPSSAIAKTPSDQSRAE